MDCNNYSYTPHILDNNTIVAYYENDDMYIEIDRQNTIYWLYATSYAPGLEISEKFTSKTAAESAYNYIVENYAYTPPEDNRELQKQIEKYSTSLLNIAYPFEFFIKL